MKRNIQHMHIEMDNIVAFDILAEDDEETLENEGVTMVVLKINILHAEHNRIFEDGSQPRSCKITSIYSTRNRVPMYLAEFGFDYFNGQVEVTQSFGQLAEILYLDDGLGLHLHSFKIAPNFGLGDIINPPPVEMANSVAGIRQDMVQIPEDVFQSLLILAFGNADNSFTHGNIGSNLLDVQNVLILDSQYGRFTYFSYACIFGSQFILLP